MQSGGLMRTKLLLVGSLSLLGVGCVSQGKYDAAIADLTRTRAAMQHDRAASERQIDDARNEIAQLKGYIAEAQKRCDRTASDLGDERDRALACARALDEATALNEALREQLVKAGKNVDQLDMLRGALADSLSQARARLEELRRARVAADARAALFHDIAVRLKRMTDSGQLQIVLRSGRMVLVLPNDVLFDSGRADVKPAGKEALGEIAHVLSTLGDRRFQVAGHTDDEPIRVSGYKSNWELSSARGLAVVAFLVKSGMRPETMSAAGYGEFDPVSPNDSPENKSKNRRIEITLQPNIDELVAVPEAG